MHPIITSTRRRLGRFQRCESGGMTIFGLYMFLTMVVLSAVALDFQHLMSERTRLQVATDLVAHGALYRRDSQTADQAKLSAIALLSAGTPVDEYGIVITADDIQFGTYDRATRVFTDNNNSRSAVRVRASRIEARGNSVASVLMQFVGIDAVDVSTVAIAETFRPTCFREGFVAQGIVDIQSNNGFTNGFCIHSNTYVSLNQNNTFEAGTIVSMPDLSLLSLPQSGFTKNLGLEAALREGSYRLRIINNLDTLIANLRTYGSTDMPAYITSPTKNYLTGKNFSPSSFTSGRIHELSCTGNSGATFASGTYRNFVAYVPCDVKFANGVNLENVVIISGSTGSKSISSPNGLVVGKDDSCAPGGGAVLITKGSMDFAANLSVFGSQLIARNNIAFAANANGIEGTSMIAGGRIDGTSNMNMGFCGTGMDNVYEANYFRLAR